MSTIGGNVTMIPVKPTQYEIFDLTTNRRENVTIERIAVRVSLTKPPEGFGISYITAGPFYITAAPDIS